MTETELKFGLDETRAAAVDVALRRLRSRRLSIESHYYDTTDGRLAAAGLSLRLRRTGRRWEQTLKAPGDSAIVRHEETVRRPGRWEAAGPPLHPALHANTAAGALLEKAMREDDASTPRLLERVCSTSLVRRQVVIEAQGAVVELAFDRGTIAAGELVRPVCELELELKSGTPAVLATLGQDGVSAHGLWLSTLSKAERGDRLVRGDAPVPAVKAQPPQLDRSMAGPALLRAALQSCLEQAIANASEIANGPPREDSVHQLRIGLRRLRTAARELGFLDPAFTPTWEPAVAATFRALGAYRDRDTVVRAIEPRLQEAGSPQPTLGSATAAPPDPTDAVRDPAFQCALLEVLKQVLRAPDDLPHSPAAALPQGRHDAVRQIDDRLSRLDRRLRRGARDFARLDVAGQHRVRKQLKRLRYLAELVGPLYAEAKVERFLMRLRPAQDALGAYVDLLVAQQMACAAAEAGDAGAWFNVGWLSAQLPEGIRRCAKALRRAAKAPRFW
jgi:inorganic triphosphatase YgiF